MPLTHPIRDAALLVRSRHPLLLVESDDYPRIRRLPLLRLDLGTLQNKYIGETEKDLRRAMPLAERLSPVVLWIDEIEKAFAGTNGEGEGGGVSLRVLGSFLSPMQDRQEEVFVLATTNDVDRLPAELLCKGRFGELFFVALPDAESRAEILRIHLRRRWAAPSKGSTSMRWLRQARGSRGRSSSRSSSRLRTPRSTPMRVKSQARRPHVKPARSSSR